jgi:quercetin dioxygenase-like cupin family protein
MIMSTRTLLRTTLALASLASVGASGAVAGECPAGKGGIDVTKPGATAPSGVKDDVISSIDLSSRPGFQGHKLRMRKLVVEPGGVVPWHNHGERPANIYVVEGAITEYRSTCSVPIQHKAGEAVAEFGAEVSHWWRNNTKRRAVLISADLLHDKTKDDHSM